MSKILDFTMSIVPAGQTARATFEGLTDGLNRSQRNSMPGALAVTNSGIVLAWTKMGIRPKLEFEAFAQTDIIEVVESDDPMPGLTGALERKNATRAMGRMMGNTTTRPTLTIRTRRGDFSLFFKPKERGELRRAFIAINDLLA